jgi:SNF2 family DNA or RNA helicase
MKPHTYRITKKECLDLPDKIYTTQYFDLSPAQMRLYRYVRDQMRYERDDGELDIYSALTVIGKLRQVTSGFINVEGSPTDLVESKPRLNALKEVLEDGTGQVIIWAAFREEIRQVVEMIGEKNCVQYHGGVTKDKDREAAIDRFQSGDVQYFIANPAAGGTGITLTAAELVVYHSCDYNLEHRLQSEDRSHRIGTKHNVVYVDLCATGTIDERIAASLQNKEATALQILDAL